MSRKFELFEINCGEKIETEKCMPQIRCTGLCVGYDSKRIASDISFTLNAGDYLCIIGENGSGKSTLMKTLLGLIPPIDGRIEFGDGVAKNQIGYLPQQTPIQRDFPASVREVVSSGCLAHSGFFPFYSKAQKKRAEDAMCKMHILDLQDRCYRELSGGQQQRVLLARALCAAERLLLLDEPVSGLDPSVSAEMYRLIGGLNREDGVSIIMISHDIGAALKYANKILCIDKQIFFGTKEEYLKLRSASPESEGGGSDELDI